MLAADLIRQLKVQSGEAALAANVFSGSRTHAVKQNCPQRTHSREDEATQRALEADAMTRQCHGCKAYVSKVEGCDKFQCRCGYRFCWACGAKDANCRCTGREHVFWDNVTSKASSPAKKEAKPVRKNPWTRY